MFTKSPQYRETNNISREKTKSTLTEGINDCIDTSCSKDDIDRSVLIDWKGKAINNIDEKMKTFSNKTSSKFHKNVILQNKPLNILNEIPNQFDVTPIDKVNDTHREKLVLKRIQHKNY